MAVPLSALNPPEWEPARPEIIDELPIALNEQRAMYHGILIGIRMVLQMAKTPSRMSVDIIGMVTSGTYTAGQVTLLDAGYKERLRQEIEKYLTTELAPAEKGKEKGK